MIVGCWSLGRLWLWMILGWQSLDALLQAAAGFDQALRQLDSARRQAKEAVLRAETQLRAGVDVAYPVAIVELRRVASSYTAAPSSHS
jgi:hypothetical protein